MLIAIDTKDVEFISTTIETTRSLLDAVHCYDYEEFYNLKKCLRILNGETLEEIEANPEE